jgi:hypothetical protein
MGYALNSIVNKFRTTSNNKYKVLAEQVFNKINSIYSAEETKTLTKLNEIINRVFSQIYSDGTTIKITENYKITLSINEVKDENLNQLQANTSKQYSVIFSFIIRNKLKL